jgi:hypothetical protein
MANKFFGAISHIGGADGDLDAISKDIISDGDGAFVVDATNNKFDIYTLDASNATAEDAVDFTCVVPDDEAASPGKRWIKVEIGNKSINTLAAIAAALRTGSDAKLVTGTAGDANDFPIWNADGDIVGSGLNVAETGVLATVAEWTKGQNFNETSLSDGATINWDLDDNQVCNVTLGGNRTMAAPTNNKQGRTYILRVVQDGTGARTLTWNAEFLWGPEGAPDLASAAADVTVFVFYDDGTSLHGSRFYNES